MKSLLSAICSLLFIALTGCIHVPQSTITGTIDGRPFSITTPKDSKLEGLEIISQSGGLTNYVTVKVQSLEAHMNPEVITTTADGQVKLIQAAGEQVRAAMQQGATKAATGGL